MKKEIKPKSYHEGANDERTVVLAKIRRTEISQCVECKRLADALVKWILKRVSRNKKRLGGL